MFESRSHFWLKIQPSLNFVWGFCVWMACPLEPVDWDQLKDKAKEWLALFPGVVGAPTREERILSAQARAWFAVLQKPRAHEAVALGAQPCSVCGLITHSWCEGCELRPFAPVCETCDAEHRVCDRCGRQGISWEAGRARYEAANSEDVAEITGFHLEDGEWVELEVPLRIPVERDQDGEIVIPEGAIQEAVRARDAGRDRPNGP